MTYKNTFFFMLLFTMLTACGSSSALFPGVSPKPPASVHPEEWAGTYAGAQGTVMTLAGNGTAHIGHAASDKPVDMESSWDFSDEMINVHCPSFISATSIVIIGWAFAILKVFEVSFGL